MNPASQESLPEDPVGAAWLMREYGVQPMGRLPVLSQMGGRRKTQTLDGFRLETYVEAMRPEPTLIGHLQFHMRYEVLHLEFLSRLFRAEGPAQIQMWVHQSPTGAYARRAAFLYEWLTGEQLHAPEKLGGNYVDAMDGASQFVASPDQVVKVSKWRVNDNLAGTPYFCPMVVKTKALLDAAALDVSALLAGLKAEFGEELLLRAAAWLTLRESKASFAIEGEGEQSSRIQRFSDVMARRTGQGSPPLDDATLAQLQTEILGPRTTITRPGVRQSPVFVGETIRYQEVVHYVAPPPEDLAQMLSGMQVFLKRTQGQSPVVRCAVTAFAFIYIHPLADGNGRVHRFLINDVLRRDRVTPDDIILPVSAVITADTGERRAYDQVLDTVSKPLMHSVRDKLSFSKTQKSYPDGVKSNFEFQAHDLARPLWRLPDLSPHVLYLSEVIHRTITEQMREESRYLRIHHRARQAIKEIVEMPDHQADRLLRSMEQNQGQLSHALAKEMPVLTQPGVWELLMQTVSEVFRSES